MPSLTPRYSFNLPTLNGEDGSWGALLNTNFEIIDTLLFDMQAMIDALDVPEHGDLVGLDDDDHPQYLTIARADTRYYTEAEVNALIAAIPKIPPGGLTDQILAKVSNANYDTQWVTITIPPSGTSDHGMLTGLADDDHPQYLNTARGDARYYTETEVNALLAAIHGIPAGGATGQVLTKIDSTNYNANWQTPATGGVTDHGLLTGLADDDHPQYLNQARGDARYYTEAEVNALIAAVPNYWTLTSSNITNNNAGNVGIGAAPGAFKLSVTGTFNATGATTLGNSLGVTGSVTLNALAGTGNRMVIASATGVLSAQTIPTIPPNYWTLTGSDIANNNAGNVGVGGAPGLFKLGVTGSGNFSDSLSVGIPADFWAGTPDGFFNLVGRPGALLGWVGSAGSNRVVVGSNAYRNNASATSYLGAGGVVNNGSQIELAPTGEIFFKNGPASGINLTQRMLIDAAGDVGIGSAPPTGKLGVDGNIGGTGNLYLYAASTVSSILELGSGRTGNGNSYIDLIGDATYTDYGLRMIRTATGANTNSQILHRGTGELSLKAVEAGTLGLYTNNAERLNISSAGLVTIANLAGSGTRMVTAGAAGGLGTQAIPSAGLVAIKGTAIPAFVGGTGISYNASRFVRWTRFDDVVHVTGRIHWTALTGSAVIVQINLGDLPMPAGLYNHLTWGMSKGVDLSSTYFHHTLWLTNSGLNIYAQPHIVSSTTDDVATYTYSSLASAGYINFGGTYHTDAT